MLRLKIIITGIFRTLTEKLYGFGLPPNLYIFIGWLFFAVFGYFFTYQLFFTSTPLGNLGKSAEGVHEKFIYPGISYFNGTKVSEGEEWTVRYAAPNVAAIGARSVEFFVYMPNFSAESDNNEIVGHIEVLQKAGNIRSSQTIELHAKQYQRVAVPWEPVGKQINRAIITYTHNGESGQESIVVASNVVVNLWNNVAIFLLVSVVFLIIGWRKQAKSQNVASVSRYILVSFCLFFVPMAMMYWFHSGFIISNMLLEGGQHGRVIGFHRQLAYILENGYMSEGSYRSSSQVLVPGLVVLVEQTSLVLTRLFAEVYPTYRFIMFALFAAANVYMVSVLRLVFGSKTSFIYFILVASFFPFIVDLYAHDIDAYFILLFPFLIGAIISIFYRIGNILWNYGLLFLVMIVMSSIKITPAFLVFAVPLVLAMFYRMRGVFSLQKGMLSGLTSFALLLLLSGGAFSIGLKIGDVFKHPNANIGIEGEPFQDTVIWHMLWAANGTYDHDSAHGFTRSGSLRNARVSEITGLEPVTYLRQSQAATDQVYKPQFINALQERPGFFLATASLRAYVDGIKLYRYTRGFRDGVFQRFLDPDTYSAEIEANRYGEGWKIAPLIMLAKFTQNDIGRYADWLLYAIGFAGLFLLRLRPLLMFMVLVFFAELTFSVSVHTINRYFMFCSTASLLGLALIFSRAFDLLYSEKFPASPTRL